MDSASIQFISFGLLLAVLSNLSPRRGWRSFVLLGGSLVFLFLLARNPIVFLPLAFFLLMGYLGLLFIEHRWVRSVSWIVVTVLFVYIWLKKYTFLPEGIFLRFPYLTLGLSYIFFRVLHLLLDASADQENYRRMSIGAYLTYTLNFTTFISGPIQRYPDFAADQFAEEPILLDAGVIGLQIERLIRGFFKVNVLAMLLEMIQADALAQLSQNLPLALKLYAAFRLAAIYPFFLYANFSGYIDIVIALARLMRLRLPENFNRPFSASSFLDFWSRWHITLSNWLKTYVYNPLLIALARRFPSNALRPFLGVLCFFVTFFLIGVWHGRTSEFMIFGVLQGGGVAINKLWQVQLTSLLGRKEYAALAKKPLYIAFGRGLTFSWFAFTLFWFWANWKQIDGIFSAISVLEWCVVWLAIWLSATVILAAWEWLRALLLSFAPGGEPMLTSRYARVVYATAFGLVSFVMTVLMNQPAPDIVYKAF